MKRGLLTLAVSLALCAAVVWLWVRSYRVSDLVAYQPSLATYSAWSERGELCLRRVDETKRTLDKYRRESVPLGGGWGRYEPPYSDERTAGGFWWESSVTAKNQPYWALVVPHWAAAAASLLPVGAAIISLVRGGRRVAKGCCKHCGYDLRGSPGRCPECGVAATGAGGADARAARRGDVSALPPDARHR